VRLRVFNRKVHFWASIFVALPLLIVISSGILLQFKKDAHWIQPKTQRGVANTPMITFQQILEVAKTAPEANFKTWNDIDRLDVRPSKGVVKVRGENRWEVQIDTKTGKVLQVARRNSDLIESIHDGTWFHEHVKLWLFFPAALVLLAMWITGMYLFIITFMARHRNKVRLREKESQAVEGNTCTDP